MIKSHAVSDKTRMARGDGFNNTIRAIHLSVPSIVTSSPLQVTGLPASRDAQRRISTGLNSAQSVRTYGFANVSPALSALRDKPDSTPMYLKVSARYSRSGCAGWLAPMQSNGVCAAPCAPVPVHRASGT